MKTKNRWLDWIVSESAALDVELPWSRSARQAKADASAAPVAQARPAAAAS